MAVQLDWIKGWNNGNGVGLAVTARSGSVVYPAGAALIDLMDTIEYFLTGVDPNGVVAPGTNRGWLAYSPSNAGTNARAYYAPTVPDAQGVTMIKPMILDYNISGQLLVATYETWTGGNPGVGTNLSQNTRSSGYGQRVDLESGGTLNICATSRLAFFFTNIPAGFGGSAANTPTFHYETGRYHAEDLAANGLPRWGVMPGGIVGFNNSQVYGAFVFPRTRGGTTSAAGSFATTMYGAAGALGNNVAGQYLMPSVANALTGKIDLSHVYCGEARSTPQIIGPVLDLILASGGGAVIGDDVPVKLAPSAKYGGTLMMDEAGDTEYRWYIRNAGYGWVVPK
jgi:hypothetical protein